MGGKGGGSASSPTEVDNSLRSRDKVRVLFALCEGECDGFEQDDALSNIYLDDTPIQNPDGSFNFSGFTVEYRTGTADQLPINGFNFVEAEAGVNQIVRKDTPVTRTLNTVDVDAIRVRIATDAFYTRDKDGNVTTTVAEFRISISSNGGPFITRATDSFDGKSSGAYRRDYTINVAAEDAPYAIRVERLSNDADVAQTDELEIRNSIFFSAYSSIQYTDNAYPGVATLAMSFDAEQFSAIPAVSVDWKGRNNIYVPANYDGSDRAYSGLFNGTLKTTYTNNPAWCFYTILRDMGVPPENLDVYDFYSLGQRCDESVPDGLGGSHPRYLFDERFESFGSRFDVMQAIASSMDCQLYLENGALKLVSNDYRAHSQIYGPANAIEGYGDDGRLEKAAFLYDATPSTDRFTACVVRWSDPDDGYNETFEEVRDEAAIAQYGYNSASIEAVGCTRRAQAVRKGRQFLFDNQREEIVTISVPRDGRLVSPGEVALVQDPARTARQDLFGRIKGRDTGVTILDRPVELQAGDVCSFETQRNGQLITKEFTATTTQTTDTIPVSYDAAEEPELNSPWLLSIGIAREGDRWKVLSITENNDDIDSYTMEGISDNIDPAPFVENFNLADDSLGTLGLFDIPDPPTDLQAIEGLHITAGVPSARIDLLWSPPATLGIRGYTVQYKLSASNDWITTSTQNNGVELLDLPVGDYDFRVRSISLAQISSEWTPTLTRNVDGTIGPPADTQSFASSPIENNLISLRWDRHENPAVLEGGYIQINHSAEAAGEWGDSMVLAQLPGSTSNADLPLMNGRYLIKPYTYSGEPSVNALGVVSTLDDEVLGRNFVASQSEFDDGFPGDKENITIDGNGFLKLTDADDGTVNTEGIYTFGTPLNLGANYACRLRAFVTLSISNPDALNRTVNTFVQVQTDSGSGYGPWETLVQNGAYQGQIFRLRLVFRSEDSSLNVSVEQAVLSIEMETRTERGTINTEAVGFSGENYARPFYAGPDLQAYIVDRQSGDILDTDSNNRTNFSFRTLNGGSQVIRTVQWTATGPGKELV